jgi:hypothetical protein
LQDAGHHVVTERHDHVERSLPALPLDQCRERIGVHVPVAKQLAAKVDDERVKTRETRNGPAQPDDFYDLWREPRLQAGTLVCIPFVGEIHLAGRDQAYELE